MGPILDVKANEYFMKTLPFQSHLEKVLRKARTMAPFADQTRTKPAQSQYSASELYSAARVKWEQLYAQASLQEKNVLDRILAILLMSSGHDILSSTANPTLLMSKIVDENKVAKALQQPNQDFSIALIALMHGHQLTIDLLLTASAYDNEPIIAATEFYHEFTRELPQTQNKCAGFVYNLKFDHSETDLSFSRLALALPKQPGHQKLPLSEIANAFSNEYGQFTSKQVNNIIQKRLQLKSCVNKSAIAHFKGHIPSVNHWFKVTEPEGLFWQIIGLFTGRNKQLQAVDVLLRNYHYADNVDTKTIALIQLGECVLNMDAKLLTKNREIYRAVGHLKVDIAIEINALVQKNINADTRQALQVLSEKLPTVRRQEDAETLVTINQNVPSKQKAMINAVDSTPQNTPRPKSDVESEKMNQENQTKQTNTTSFVHRPKPHIPFKILLKDNPFSLFTKPKPASCAVQQRKSEATSALRTILRPGT